MESDLETYLRERAKSWAQQIEDKAKRASGKPAHIVVTAKASGAKGGAVGINVDATSAKGDARAYEYGSGIHSTTSKTSRWQQGAKGKILITPKRAKVLAFYWDKLSNDPPGTWYGGRKLIRKREDDVALFRYVEHPGVKAANGGKGYMRPAISEVRKTIRKEIPKGMRDAYVGGIRKAFRK